MSNRADTQPERKVRSFVRRAGRMTRAQERAWRELWPRYGIDAEEPAAVAAAFRGGARLVLEVGFGNGESLLDQAEDDPETRYYGIEVHEPGIGHCLLGIERRGIDNLRLLCGDALEIMEAIPEGSIARLNLYFPDPWPKKRHHKRRIVAPRFLDLAARVLAPGGTLHIATDWASYAEHIDEVVATDQRFELVERREHEGDRPLARPRTKFEHRGLRLGHGICDWIYRLR
ncbi:tRNA (guanosine(46)-N7)-methyltransferase TrmB [Lentisalinibacter salinarum]|uniref:tRNA (guanosine(46)-N7)-methyltransferase TrmB n=1 Tax=Lentisalinibacter salinarum TaxID=2992239 RepID=UPI00386B8584